MILDLDQQHLWQNTLVALDTVASPTRLILIGYSFGKNVKKRTLIGQIPLFLLWFQSHNQHIISIFYHFSTFPSPLAGTSTGLDGFPGGISDMALSWMVLDVFCEEELHNTGTQKSRLTEPTFGEGVESPNTSSGQWKWWFQILFPIPIFLRVQVSISI